MSITPGFISELRNRLVLSDLVGRKVRWDKRKSNPRKRDYWACCPFHHEKSPSFHVEDDKGRYYCFGCGQKGDAITFLMEMESLSFREAVESLAADVGLTVPQPTREEARKERVRATLADAMQMAAEFFQGELLGPMGGEARAYLERRNLSPETIARFALGFAPGTGKALIEHLTKRDVPIEVLRQGGLAGQRDPDRPPYDYFRNRLMFPIRDRQGRVIGFGARALADGAEPKYLNSPETDLFKKGRVLYNLDHARKASRAADTVLIAEGYMDVIAFDRAGLPAAVAPLGTALTEDQLGEVWRLAHEPVLCFDGDDAGLKAAYRALDTALPLLTPERTMRFCLLPGGQDPDDVLNASGPEGLKSVLARTSSVADLLWKREIEAQPTDTPERRAALEHRLQEAVGLVSDASLQHHFRQDMRNRAKDFFWAQRGASFRARGSGPARRGGQGAANAPTGTRALLDSAIARQARAGALSRGPDLRDRIAAQLEQINRTRLLHERRLLALAIEYPQVAGRDCEQFADVEFLSRETEDLRRALLGVLEEHNDLDSLTLKLHLSQQGKERLVDAVLTCAMTRQSYLRFAARREDELQQEWQRLVAEYHRFTSRLAALRLLIADRHDDEAAWEQVKRFRREIEAA